MNDPWLKESMSDKVSTNNYFEDNFSIDSVDEQQLNENGLCLPESQRYLNYLENCLKKLNSDNNLNKQGKKMLKELSLKRDGLFEFNVPESDTISIPEEETETNLISEAIINSNIYDQMERKLFPHLHSIDPEETKKLINHDVLDFIVASNNRSMGDDESK